MSLIAGLSYLSYTSLRSGCLINDINSLGRRHKAVSHPVYYCPQRRTIEGRFFMDDILDIDDGTGIEEDGLNNTAEFGGIYVRNRKMGREVRP